MAYDILKGASGTPLIFFLVESADHITGLTAASPTVTISKNGGTFATPSGAVSEIANGWYKVAGNATDTGTAGPLALHATAASADPCDIVVANIIDNTVATYGANLVDISGSAVSTTSAQLGVNVVDINAVAASSVTTINANLGTTQPVNFTGTAASALVKSDMVDVAGAAVSTATAQLGVNVVTNGDKTGYSLTQTFPTNFSSLAIDLSGDVTYNNTAPPSTASIASAVLTTQMTESYAAKGTVPTLAQLLFEVRSLQAEKSVSGTTLTSKKIDGTTSAATFTLNDATAPTSITRAT